MSQERLALALADRYRIERELGAGGMATVYLAQDLKHDRQVALKVLKPELAAVIGASRFLVEIKTTANLQHPHILSLHDSGEVDGTVFYVMPFVDGESLRDRLNREKQLPISDAVRIASEAADALEYAHKQGVIHRDIKPENILLHGGHALVADFGIALAASKTAGTRMTETGMSLGTPTYMSPEQAMGERNIDARTDVYALGCVLYEMLTGEPPFTGPTAQAIVAKVLTDQPRPASELRHSVPPNVEAAIRTALEKLPADRFSTMAEFAAAMHAVSVPARGSTPRRSDSSARLMVALLGVGALASGTIIGRLLPRRADAPAVIGFHPIRLTHSGGVGCATLSPDGREFAAVIGTYDEETNCTGALVIRAVPSGVDQVVLPRVRGVLHINWNPSATTLLLDGAPEGRSSGLWEIPRSGGAPRQLSTHGATWYGFLDDQRVFTRDPAGSHILDAQSGETLDSLPQFRGATDDPDDPMVWSPDGRFLLLSRPTVRHGTAILNARGEVIDSVPGNFRLVSWAGPGRVAYYVNRAFGTGDVLVRDVDPASGRFRGPPSVVWAALPAILQLSSSRTGDRLMVVVRPVVDEQHLIQAGAPGASRVLVRSLNAYLGDPHLSPDGTRVAYTREDPLGFNAYWMGAEGGQEHPITRDSVATIDADWFDEHRVRTLTPEGARIEVDLDNGRARRIEDLGAARLADGYRAIRIWRQGDPGRYVARDTAGRALGEMGSVPDLQGTAGHGYAGAAGFVTWGITRDQLQAMTGYSFASGKWSTPVPLTQSGMRLAGFGDDGAVYFARFGEQYTEIWRSRDMESAPALFLTLGIHCYNGSVNVSRDGKRIVCNVTTSQPDAWLVELPPVGR